MALIHPTAVIERGAELDESVTVGAFAYVGPHVKLGARCIVHHHAMLEGHTTAGPDNEFFPNCLVGALPQDLKYRGGDCRVVIGARNKFREGCTVHIGTEDGGSETVIGDDNLFMVGSHIAHDCLIGNGCILANNVLLAGHVLLEDYVVISGAAGSHHFVRFGKHSFVGGLAGITRDVPPYMIVDGHPGIVRGVNFTGLKRRGFTEEQIDSLKIAYRLLFKDSTPMAPMFEQLRKMYPSSDVITYLVSFMQYAMQGKYGRFRENLRGKPNTEEEDAGTVSGN